MQQSKEGLQLAENTSMSVWPVSLTRRVPLFIIQKASFKRVLDPGGILKISLLFVESRDGMIRPELCPHLRKD